MDMIGKILGGRYEIIEKLAKVEWQKFTKQNAIF